MTGLYINPLTITDKLRSGRRFLILILLYGPSILGRDGCTDQLLARLLCLVQQLLVVCGNMGSRGCCGCGY
jgi:hypothetical protein